MQVARDLGLGGGYSGFAQLLTTGQSHLILNMVVK